MGLHVKRIISNSEHLVSFNLSLEGCNRAELFQIEKIMEELGKR